MPIRRTYACPECNNFWEIVLTLDQADDPAPSCPVCDARDVRQQFKAPGIINASPRSRAEALTEDILANDYHVADINRSPSRSSVRYKDSSPNELPSNWNALKIPAAMETAMALGRQDRLQWGTGLDVLQSNLKNGTQPDLIELSKARSVKVW